jgi:hypothetical protein
MPTTPEPAALRPAEALGDGRRRVWALARYRRPSGPFPLLTRLMCGIGGLGVVLMTAAVLLAPEAPPQPAGDPPGAGVGAAPAADRSTPFRVRVPGIKVDAPVADMGVATDGTLQVPELTQPELAGWYRLGPSPGESGNAVIVGHVDSRAAGPAVFFELGALRPGAVVEVDREDGRVVLFTVDGVVSYPKKEFPQDLVYGASPVPSLRLITCGGAFDRASRQYSDSVVVFATLTGWA